MDSACILLLFVIVFLLGWNVRTQRLAKAQIRQREKKLQTILDNAPIVFSAIDENGIFTNSEGKGLEKLGRRSNESVGMSVYEIHNGNPVILESIARALKGEVIETTFILRGITFELFMVPEKNSAGSVTGVSMLSVDIDEQKKIEKEKAQLQAREESALATSKLKSEFLATMSHEIRTPINGVLGMTSLLFDTPLSPDQREYAEGIQQSGSALLTIINDILDFSKIEAGKMDFEEIFFDLRETILHTLKNLNFAAKGKGIDLRSEFSAEFPSFYRGDPGRVRQILNNLIGNALKFTTEGSVVLRASTSEKTPSTSTIQIEIEDTGIGIAAEALGRLFVAFSQGEASMARRFGGTGLGLSISKQLVEKMNGDIGVRSLLGKGSTFWFTVKLHNAERPLARDYGKTNLPVLHTANQDAPLILVAEDNKINQIITMKMLEKMGCTVELAENGRVAAHACNRTRFDLILMDCQMPEMDGLEATRTIRVSSKFSENQGVPILAMTANAMKGDEEKCLAAGMDSYLSKPVTAKQLAEKVTFWLDVGEKRRASQARHSA